MHWVISGSFGPTDPTRAMLPFLFAASALQAGDSVTLMLFHDAVLMAVDGVGKTLVPVRPTQPLRRDRRPRQGDAVGVPALRESKIRQFS
jgi:predicted peroxiredoxin